MEVLDRYIARRREINAFYRDRLSGIPGISFLDNPSTEFESNHWLTCIVVDPAIAGFTREDLRLAMEAENIETRPLWKPMHLQPLYSNSPFYGDGTSEALFKKGLCLPSGPILTEADLERIVAVFGTFTSGR
jgi:dTDP-4-amino-4,6-dideoxygalactose transaminase